MLVVEDTVTWYPAGTAPAATICFVVWPVRPTAVVWYTYALPMATGNGIELACTNESELALDRAPMGAPLSQKQAGKGCPAGPRQTGCERTSSLVTVTQAKAHPLPGPPLRLFRVAT